jgi:branched-chain amino acid transport system ATP-binding protein
LLTISGLESRYGGIVALKGVDLEVRSGELVTIIGANGAGKSTLLKSIMGLVHRAARAMTFEGCDISRLSPLEIVRLGVALVPEGRQIFGPMTVSDNLEVGAYLDRGRRGVVRERLEAVCRLFPVLQERSRQLAGSLSGGEQQMLAIGRALMAGPKLLLVDELSLGLAPVVVHELYRRLVELHRDGMTIVIVEQNARLALSACDRAYVMSTGVVAMEGRGRQLLENEAVRRAYLGGSSTGDR